MRNQRLFCGRGLPRLQLIGPDWLLPSLCFSSEDVCKRGFTVIIDMRGSKWELIKPLLKTLQEFFPAEICVALIIKPDNFWQKQKTNFGSAKFSFEVRPCFSWFCWFCWFC